MNNMIRFGRNMVSLGRPTSFMTRRPAPKLLEPAFPSKVDDPAVVGTVLTRVPGVYVDAVTVTWVWYSNDTERQVGGATYTAVAADVLTVIRFVETATNPGGSTVNSTSGVLIE